MDTMTPTEEGPARRNTTMIVVGAALIVIGILAVLTMVGSGVSEESTSSFGGVAVVDFDLDNASIDIRAGGDEVVVEKTVSTGLFGGSATEEQAGDTLQVVLDCQPFFGFGCKGSYVVTVPAATEIVGATANGSIELADLSGPVDVASSNGGIDLQGVSGEVVVRTSNGRIDGEDLQSSTLTARTSNGGISLSFEVAPESVEARTSNGPVEIQLPSDAPAYAVSASTSNGEVETGIRTDPVAGPTLDIDTSNGDIVLRYR